MKTSVKLHSAFTFMFIDMLMVLLIFFICLTPNLVVEGALISHLPKDDGLAPLYSQKNVEKIMIYTNGQQIMVGSNVFRGEGRYKKLQNFLHMVIPQIRRFQKVDKIKIVLDQENETPFATTISLLDVCHSLPQVKEGFAQVVFNYIAEETDK